MSNTSSNTSLPSAPSAPSAPASSPSPTSSGTPTASSVSTSDTTSSDTTSTSATTTSSAPTTSSSAPSVPPSSSSTTTSSSSPSPTTSAAPVSTSLHVTVSTDAGGGIVTLTQTVPVTQSSSASASSTAAVRTASKGFLQNKAAVGATFAIVGLVAAGLIFALVTNALRRRRAKRFDREIAEEAKRAPAPVFVDDDEYPDYGSSAYGAHADPYGAAGYADGGYNAGAADPYVEHNAAGAGAHTAEDALSSGVHSNPGGGGTPSNYMYPSGYSDLGFSDVSSHGTFAQPPMEAAAYGAAGAYEMVGYGAHGGAHPTQEWGGQPHEGWAPQEGWHNGQGQGQQEAWHNGGQQQYAYPGDDSTAVGGSSYPPTSAGSSDIGRSKSGKSGGARSLVDSYGVPPTAAAAPVIPGAQTKYADGYVSQYQAREHDAYGGLESHHGHVGGLDEGEESEAEEGDGRRVLKVANE